MKKIILQLIPFILNTLFIILNYIARHGVIGIQISTGYIGAFEIYMNLIAPFWLLLINYKEFGKNFKSDAWNIAKIYFYTKIGLLIYLLPNYVPHNAEGWMLYNTIWLFGSIVIIIGSITISLVIRLRRKLKRDKLS